MNDARGVEIKVGDKVGTFKGGSWKLWIERTVEAVDDYYEVGYRNNPGAIRLTTGRWVPPYNWVVVV